MMTGLADGEVPQTTLEAVVTLIVMLLGIFTFATIIGSVSTIVDELSENESVFQTKLLFMCVVAVHLRVSAWLDEAVAVTYPHTLCDAYCVLVRNEGRGC